MKYNNKISINIYILWCRKVYNTFLTTENRKKLSPKAIFLLSFLIVFMFMVYSYAQDSPQTVAQSSNKEKTDFLVDLDFKEADIQDVARAFSHISGINIIVSDEVNKGYIKSTVYGLERSIEYDLRSI